MRFHECWCVVCDTHVEKCVWACVFAVWTCECWHQNTQAKYSFSLTYDTYCMLESFYNTLLCQFTSFIDVTLMSSFLETACEHYSEKAPPGESHPLLKKCILTMCISYFRDHACFCLTAMLHPPIWLHSVSLCITKCIVSSPREPWIHMSHKA